MVRALKVLLALFLVLTAGPAPAQSNLPPVLREVGFDQRLDQPIPLDLEFKDETGQTVQLKDYFGNKPVILVLAYFRCPMLCNEVLNGLVRGLLDVPFDVGKEFNVLTVSFDPRDTPTMAAAKKKTYLERYARPGAEAGWHFLTGDQDAIHRLTQAVGFRYVYDARNDQFAHASGIMLLTPTGRLSRYFYDVSFKPLDLRLGLVEASANKIGSRIEQALLFCFHYDPIEGRYGPVVMNIVRLVSALTVVALAGFVGLMLWRERRKTGTGPVAAGDAAAP